MNERGIWTQEEANTGHAFSYRLAQFIGNLFKGDVYTPIYDFGCGKGAYVRYLEDIGFKDVIGFEGGELKDNESDLIIVADLSEKIKVVSNLGHVISIEVGEHIPAKYEKNFIDNLCNHVADDHFLILSWAHEGQQGYGHVNCKPGWYVVGEIEKKGFLLQDLKTKEIRSVIEGHYAYLKENLFVFKKIL